MALPARVFVFAAAFALLSSCANPSMRYHGELSARPVHMRDSKPSRLVVGNYCGPGTRYGSLAYKPVDRLDGACLEHDACYIQNRNRIECNAEFIQRLDAIIADGKTSKELRRRARVARSIIKLPVFQMFPDGLFPPRKQDVLRTRYRGVDGA
jgi:hypothetical protein